MKNSLYYLLVFKTFFSFSQETKIPAGEYNSDKNQPEKISITIEEGNKYKISILSGVYEQKNDSLVFGNENEFEPIFLLEYSNPNPKSNQLNLQFVDTDTFYFSDKYIGIQKTELSEIEYKSIKELLNYNEYSYQEPVYNATIEKPFALYFVSDNSKKVSVIEKYILPQKTSLVSIKYNKANASRMRLTGFYNKETKVLTIGEGKRSIVNFKLNNPAEEKTDRTLPSETNKVSNWTYPGKPIRNEYDYIADSAAVAVDTTGYYYKFKLKIDTTLKDALKTAKSQKSRFLVIVNNSSSATSVSDFNKFSKQYETEIGYTMYEKYNPQYDRYNFYNATTKDASALKKYGVTNVPSILVLNSDGDLVYQYNGKIADENNNYYNSESFYNNLNATNEKLKLDRLFLNKKTAATDLEKKLLDISMLDIADSYIENNTTEDISPVPVDVNDVVVDTAVAVVDYSYSYNLFVSKNAYKFKTTQSQLNAKWGKILEQRLIDKQVNLTTVALILKELNHEGFNRKLFGSNETFRNQSEIQSVKYLIKQYNKIILEKQNDTVASGYEDYNLNYLITQVLDRNLNSEAPLAKENQTNLITIYKDLVVISNNNPQVIKSYMFALKQAEFKDDYLKLYKDYFNSVVKADTNIIEALDNAFQNNEESGIDWAGFKYDFANTANDAAWFVVENSKDKMQINAAINWSETSLKIQKNNPYYLDTLAQLYYKNGETEKAITTEQKAIDAINPEEADQTETYKAVLEKMQNGTY